MQPKANVRRIRADRGIYYREAQVGRRYEISYIDSTGRQRWQVVPGGLRDARAARAEVISRLARGERVAPSRLTLADVATAWIAAQTHLRPSTYERYEAVLRIHVLSRLGRIRLVALTEDDVVSLIAAMRAKGLAAATINKTVMVLGRVLGHAARRGLIPTNPVARLERGERPASDRREMRFLERDEIVQLILQADRYRPLLAAAIFTGLRLGELLALRWADVDLTAGLVRVRKQLDRHGVRVEPKTPKAVREVVLMPALGRILRESRVSSRFSGDDDPVFVSTAGTPMHYRNINRRGLSVAAERAGLNGGDRPNLRFHDLRHTFASLLIAEGANIVFVSRQLGHASPDITLRVYAHLFDRAAHAEHTRQALEGGYGKLVESACGEQWQTQVADESRKPVVTAVSSPGGDSWRMAGPL
jgi:integrase